MQKIVAKFKTALAAGITASATSATLISALTGDGSDLPAGTYGFVLEEGTINEEFISADVSTVNLTNIVRGLSYQDGDTEVAGLKKAHRKGASIKVTDFPILGKLVGVYNGSKAFEAVPLLPSSRSITNNRHIVDKEYADGIAIAGGVDASTTTKGISKLSTAPVSASNPIAVGDNDGRLPSTDQKAALAGTSGTPSSSNKYVTDADATTAKTASKIARRDSNGDVLVATTPTNADAAISKTYLETQIAAFDTSYFALEASSVVRTASAAEVTSASTSYVKVKEILLNDVSGTITVAWDMKSVSGTYLVYAKVYKNGVAVGTEKTQNNSSYLEHTDSLSFSRGDLIQLYVKVQTNPENISVRDFELRYTRALKAYPIANTVNL